MEENVCYTETLSSTRTKALFFGLTLLFGGLYACRMHSRNTDTLKNVFCGLSLVFLFYTINYRKLTILITPQDLRLKFGIFTWTEAIGNMAECSFDKLPWLMRYGGAGIHFMSIAQRYRASFNFLEYSRVVVSLKEKRGPVQDLSFSTRQPEIVQQLLRQRIVQTEPA